MSPAVPPTATLTQRVRLRIYQHFLEHARAPVIEQLMTEFDLTRAQASDTLRDLAHARHIALVRGTLRILMAFPFSAIATPFVVGARGNSYFANCSWDSIAFHAMLQDDVRVDAMCHHCARPIAVEMSDGRATLVQPNTSLVFLALRPTQWWEDIITTCSNTMVFFCSPEHRDASDLHAPADETASLTPDEVHRLSIPLYRDRLSLGYERPRREELSAHFAALGLIGPYWRL